MATRNDRGFRFPKDKYDEKIALYENFRYLETYLNYIRKKDFHSAQLIVAASNTENPHAAHIVCDGTADEVTVQAGVDALDATEIEVVFLDGDYAFAAEGVDFGAKHVNVRGTGWPLITYVNSGFTGTGDSLYEGLRFAGGVTNQDGAINSRGDTNLFVVRNCRFDTITGRVIISPNDGASADSENFFAIYGNTFADITLSGGGGASPRGLIWMDAASSQTFNGAVFGNRFEDVAGGNIFESNSTKRVMIYGNVFQSCTLDTGEATYFHNWVDGVFTAGEHSIALGDLSDVGDGAPTLGDIIVGDGDSWEATPAAEYVADIVGTMVTGNTETRIAVTYDDADNTLDFVVNLTLGELSNVGDGDPSVDDLLLGDGGTWEATPVGSFDVAKFGSSTATDGFVLTADGAGGSAFEAASSGTLDGLTDVVITTPADNELLAYNTGTSQWINQTPAEAALVAVADLAWTTWSPSYTNITVGNGTVVARYVQIGKTVIARFEFILGSTSTVGSNPTVSTPVTGSSSGYSASNNSLGDFVILDSGNTRFFGTVTFGTTTTFGFLIHNTSGTYAFQDFISSTVPMTWTTGDVFGFQAIYEAA